MAHPPTLDDLRHHRGVFHTNRGAADWRFQTSNGPVSVQAHSMFGVTNGDMMRDAAIAGLGLAMLPAFLAGPAVKAGELVAVPLDDEPDEEFLYMAHAQRRNPLAKLRALREHLLGCFGAPPYWDVVM